MDAYHSRHGFINSFITVAQRPNLFFLLIFGLQKDLQNAHFEMHFYYLICICNVSSEIVLELLIYFHIGDRCSKHLVYEGAARSS